MPKQPNPNQIAETPLRPSLSAPQINIGVASSIGAGGRAIGAAIADVGSAFGQIAARSAAVDEAQSQAKWDIDWFKAKSEIERDVTQNAREDGTGYETLAPRLAQKAKEMQESGRYSTSSSRAHVRREIGVAKDVATYGARAARTSQNMKAKHYQTGQDNQLAGLVKDVGENPSEEVYRAKLEQAKQLIEAGKGAYSTQAYVDKRTREITAEMTLTRLSKLQSDPVAAEEARKQLENARRKPQNKTLDASKNTKAELGQYKIFADGKRVPTAAERRQLRKSGSVVVNLDSNWSKGGSTSPMIVIPDDASTEMRAQAQAYVDAVAKHNREKLGINLAPKVVTRSQNGRGRSNTIHTEPFAVTDKKAVTYYGSEEGQQAHAEILRSTLGKIPGVYFSLPHNEAKGDKGAHGNGTNEVDLARGVLARLGQGVGSAEPAKDGEILPPIPEQNRPSLSNIIPPQPQSANGLASLVSEDDLLRDRQRQRLEEIARERPDANISEVLTSRQLKKLREFVPEGVDVEGLTVGSVAKMFQTAEAEQAAASIERELSIAENPSQQQGDGNSGLVEAGQGIHVKSPTLGEIKISAEELNSLTPQQQKAWSRSTIQARNAFTAKLKTKITDIEKHAIDGRPLPVDYFEKMKAAIARTGDPELGRRLDQAVALADDIRKLRSQPVEVNEAILNKYATLFNDRGAPPEQKEYLKKLEQSVAKQKIGIKSDQLTWGHNANVAQIMPLRLGDPKSMAARAQAAQKTATTYKIPVKYFTEQDKVALGQALETGKLKASKVAALIMKGWGRVEGLKAMHELFDKAPSAAALGGLLNKVGNVPVVNDVETGQELLKQKGVKPYFKSSDVEGQVEKALRGGVSHGDSAYQFMPKASNVIRDMANSAYQARAARYGWDTFKEAEYQKIVGELLGQRTVGGATYGGVSREMYWNGPGWGFSADAKQYAVVVPHDVRQDGFDDLIQGKGADGKPYLSLSDLPSRPMQGGRPITDAQFKEAQLISIGDGRYWLAQSVIDGRPVTYKDADGRNYVFDFATVREMLQVKRPDLFYK